MRVSIIVPVYEVSAYVERCLQSVLNQTYTDIECIIVDDASPDDSIARCERMIAAYHGPIQFTILHHERNRGLSAARNTGTAAATGDYLYYLDSDDEITPDCIEKLMACVAAHPDVEMVQGAACRHLLGGREVAAPGKVSTLYLESNDAAREAYFKAGQIYVNVWNKLLRRDFIIENEILCKEGLLYEDNLWEFYLLKHLKRAAFCPDVTYHQRKRPRSITTGTGEQVRMESMAKIYREVLETLTPGHEREEYSVYAKSISALYVECGRTVPAFRQVLQQYIANCDQYGSKSLYSQLHLSLFLGRFKHGYAVWSGMSQIKHFFQPAIRCSHA